MTAASDAYRSRVPVHPTWLAELRSVADIPFSPARSGGMRAAFRAASLELEHRAEMIHAKSDRERRGASEVLYAAAVTLWEMSTRMPDEEPHQDG